ncbi:MAG: D-tyrosyl-tRNA(Tyr) deacylase [Sphaerochaetaceae bacterium]|nr:D-tyrosyl-tRNA(Tyr) deacylase [Sphaerochaetaceae bacterium]
MRAVVQRVREASVTVDGVTVGSIDEGLLVYLGVSDADDEKICRRMAEKIFRLRIFSDENGKMNRSLTDTGAGILAVSQFTLYASVKGCNRPSLSGAGKPEHAEALYEKFKTYLREEGCKVACGVFGAHMHVCYENDGPVTLIIDSDELF